MRSGTPTERATTKTNKKRRTTHAGLLIITEAKGGNLWKNVLTAKQNQGTFPQGLKSCKTGTIPTTQHLEDERFDNRHEETILQRKLETIEKNLLEPSLSSRSVRMSKMKTKESR